MVTFAPGETSKTINVVVFGDNTVEDNEDFKVVLEFAIGAEIDDVEGVGMILNDDSEGGGGGGNGKGRGKPKAPREIEARDPVWWFEADGYADAQEQVQQWEFYRYFDAEIHHDEHTLDAPAPADVVLNSLFNRESVSVSLSDSLNSDSDNTNQQQHVSGRLSSRYGTSSQVMRVSTISSQQNQSDESLEKFVAETLDSVFADLDIDDLRA
jgi:hypothetical protein